MKLLSDTFYKVTSHDICTTVPLSVLRLLFDKTAHAETELYRHEMLKNNRDNARLLPLVVDHNLVMLIDIEHEN